MKNIEISFRNGQALGPNSDATSGHDDHGARLKLRLVPLQKFTQRGDLLVNPHFHEPHDCPMRTPMDKDKLSKVLVLDYKDSVFTQREIEENFVFCRWGNV